MIRGRIISFAIPTPMLNNQGPNNAAFIAASVYFGKMQTDRANLDSKLHRPKGFSYYNVGACLLYLHVYLQEVVCYALFVRYECEAQEQARFPGTSRRKTLNEICFANARIF